MLLRGFNFRNRSSHNCQHHYQNTSENWMKVQHVHNHNPPSSISSGPQLTIQIRGEPSGDTLCKSTSQKSNINPRSTSNVQIQELANWKIGEQRVTQHLNNVYGLAHLLTMACHGHLRVGGSGRVVAYEKFSHVHRVDKQTTFDKQKPRALSIGGQ